MDEKEEKFWNKVARTVVKAGGMPLPVSKSLIELLQTIMTEEEGKFVTSVFVRKPNLTIDQIKENTELNDEQLSKLLDVLQYKGVIAGSQSKTTGVTVYRLQPPFPGMFEFQLMRPGNGEREKNLARIFDNLFKEMSESTQRVYDTLMPQYKNFPPITRVIPVEKEVEPREELVMPIYDVKKIIEKYKDEIAIALCYCRHEKDLLGEPCKLNAPRTNCFLFGKTAKFCIEKEFAKPITMDEAMKILAESEDAGLVHKAFHIHQDPTRDLEAICNCCNCCCGIFQLFNKGVMPFYTISSYIAKVNADNCIGCNQCVERCPMHAIELEDAIAKVNEERCIGCGVCTNFCTSDAIHLKRVETPRKVFVPPPRLKIE